MADYSSDVKFVDDDPYVGSNVSERGGLLDYGRGKEKRRSRDWEAMRTDPDTMAAQLEFEYGIDPDLALYLFQKEYNANGSGFVNDEEKIRGAISSVADIFRESVSIINKEEFKSHEAEGYTTNVSAQAGTERQDLIIKRLNEEGYIPFSSNEEFSNVFSNDSGAREAIQNGEDIDFDPETKIITYNGESYNADSRADSEQNLGYLDNIESVKNSNRPQEEKDKLISFIKSGLNDSRANVGLDADYTDLGASKGASQMDHLESLKAKGSQSNSYEELVDNGKTWLETQEDNERGSEIYDKHGTAMEENASQGTGATNTRRSAYTALINEGYSPDQITEDAISSKMNSLNSDPTGLNRDKGAFSEDYTGQVVKGEEELDPGSANNQVDPDDTNPDDTNPDDNTNDGTGTDTKEDGATTTDEDSSSFSGTISPESKYRALLEGQLATGLSDSLAGRPSNSILAGERMGAEGLSRLAADNIGTASQGVSNSGNLGQGAAINASQGVARANTQEFGTMAARNTLARANEQKEARAQTQDFLQYSEGVRKSKVTEDNMKLGSMLDWYKELKSTSPGQSEALMQGMNEITGTKLTAEQEQAQKELAIKSSQESVSRSTAQTYIDESDWSSLASEFSIDPSTGSYVYNDGTGDLRSVDAETNALIKSKLSFKGFSGFQYDEAGRVITNGNFDQVEFNKNSSLAFSNNDFDSLEKFRSYIPNYGTGGNYEVANNSSVGSIIEYNGEFVKVQEISSNGVVRLQGEDGIIFTIGAE